VCAQALPLRGVARRAGVSPAAPYHHFPDKQALLDAVAERGFHALNAAMMTRMDKVSGSAARSVTCHCDVSHGELWRHALRLRVVACHSADDQKGERQGMWVTIPTINGRRVTV
jgi:AcrR family transcriptional regulator